MFSRYFLIGLLPMIASCTFPWSSVPVEERTFESDYGEVIATEFPDFIRWDLTEKLDTLYAPFYPSGYDTSTLRFYYGEETVGSGDITIMTDAVREGWKHFSADLSITGGINTPRDTLTLDDVRGSFMVRQPSEFFMKLDNFQVAGSLAKIFLDVIGDVSPYIGKWYTYDQFEVSSLMLGEIDTEASPFFTVYIGFLRDIMTNGFSTVEDTLIQHPPFTPLTIIGTLSGDMVSYPVRFDPERASEGVLAFYNIYLWTGVLSEEQSMSLRSFMDEVSGTGVFAVHQDDPEIHSFSGIFSHQGEEMQVLLDSTHDTQLFHIWNEEGWIRSLYERKTDDIIVYSLIIEEANSPIFSMSFSGEFSGREKSFTFSVVEENRTFFTTDFSLDGYDFALETVSQESDTDPVTMSFSGTLDRKTLISDLSISVRSGESIITGKLDIDDDHGFTGSLQIPTWEIMVQGHVKKDDLLIKGTALGMSANLSHIREKDGAWKWNMTFPVGNITWNGKTEDRVLRDFHFRVTSPVVSVSTDLLEDGSWVRGPFRITAQGEDVLTGTLMLERRPKILNLRVDMTDPATLKPLWFESMTDIRWSDDARVVFPENTLSIIEALSGVLLPELQDEFSGDMSDQYLNN